MNETETRCHRCNSIMPVGTAQISPEDQWGLQFFVCTICNHHLIWENSPANPANQVKQEEAEQQEPEKETAPEKHVSLHSYKGISCQLMTFGYEPNITAILYLFEGNWFFSIDVHESDEVTWSTEEFIVMDDTSIDHDLLEQQKVVQEFLDSGYAL